MTEMESNWTVITGSTGGIGTEIAKIVAGRGDHLILVNRSPQKAERQRSELLAGHAGLSIELVTADFMDTASIAKAIGEIVALPGRIDTLYNNAGVLTSEKILSEQGFESHFAVNVLAPYQLIKGLRTTMARTSSDKSAMIINFSSSAIKQQKSLDLKSLANPDRVTGLMGTYAQSKLAVTAMSVALADSLAEDHILIRAVDPGPTKTSMTKGNAAMPKPLQWLAPLLFSPAEKQARKVIDAADVSMFEKGSGVLIANRKKKNLPKTAAGATTQNQLLTLLDHSLAASSD
ncbi:MAG: SDR family NAD(P)-dependent oxidoreductase [Planctomycetota bacterium]